MKKYDLAVLIGKYRYVHDGHLENFKQAAAIADKILILNGSSHMARNHKLPTRFIENKQVLSEIVRNHVTDHFDVRPLTDNPYDNNDWITQVQSHVQNAIDQLGLVTSRLGRAPRIVLVGHHKDDSSKYLDWFPQWEQVETESFCRAGDGMILNATDLREASYNAGTLKLDLIRNNVPREMWDFLQKFDSTEAFQNCVQEYKFIEDPEEGYKAKYGRNPTAPIHVTVDCVAICNGHILLVKRRTHPGKGLWALPGGFLNDNEWIEDAIIRELMEETSIRIPGIKDDHLHDHLKSLIGEPKVFGAPSRSLRGRVITHIGRLVLHGFKTPPKVRGSDDALRAKWWAINDFYNMPEQMFEDHSPAGRVMINSIGR